MSFTIVNFSKRLYYYYQPYFGLSKKAKWRSISAFMIVACNIASAIVISFFNTAMQSLFGVLEAPDVTWSAFLGASTLCFTHIALFFAISIFKNIVIAHLTNSLSKAIDKQVLKRWIINKAYYGLKFLPGKKRLAEDDNEAELNPAQILAYDNNELIGNIVNLADDLISTICMFIVGLIALYSLSISFSFALLGLTITIPGFLAVGTLAYAAAYNYITQKLSDPLKLAEAISKQAKSTLYQKSHEILTYAESIAFLKGTEHEYNSLKNTLLSINTASDAASNIKRILYSITMFHQLIGVYFMPIFLAAPSIIAKEMAMSALYQILNYFQSVVRLFIWKNENLPMLTICELSLSRIEHFNALLTAWETQQTAAELNKITIKLHKSPDIIKFENLNILNPNGSPILNAQGLPVLQNVNFLLKKGKATLIQAESGNGKTTLLRAIAGLWPYLNAGGKIVLPENRLNIQFIPQDAFVYHKGNTLLQTIIYPVTDTNDPSQLDYIKALMQKVGLKSSIINDLETVQDWNKVLSGGEKQRIAIISALIKKPDVLFMDEATSAIDHAMKAQVEKLIKETLPECAIGYTDHNPTHEPLQSTRRTRSYTPARDFRFRDATLKLNNAVTRTRLAR